MKSFATVALSAASFAVALDNHANLQSQIDLQIANLKATLVSSATLPPSQRKALFHTVTDQVREIGGLIEVADLQKYSRVVADDSPGVVGTVTGTVTGVGKQLLGTVGGLLSPVTGLLGGLLGGLLSPLGLGGLGNVVSEVCSVFRGDEGSFLDGMYKGRMTAMKRPCVLTLYEQIGA